MYIPQVKNRQKWTEVKMASDKLRDLLPSFHKLSLVPHDFEAFPGFPPPKNLGFCVVAQVQPELPHWRKHRFHELNFGDKRIRSPPLL